MTSRQLRIRIASVAALIALVATVGAPAGPARADNMGGRFTVCGQLIEFVAPSDASDGSFTIFGIGPGLYNEPDDETSHHFPFAPDMVMPPDVLEDLAALTEGLSFTCLALEAGAGPDLVAEEVQSIVLDRQVQVCGAISRDRLGVFSIAEGTDHPTSLVADAEPLLEEFEGWRLRGLLTEAAEAPDQPRVCLHLQLGPDGVLESIAFDGSFGYCDQVIPGAAYLMIGEVYLWPESLVPDQARAALAFVGQTGGRACWALEVLASQLLSVIASGDLEWCGYASEDEFGQLTIAEIPIVPGLLRDDETDRLRAAAASDGSACLSILIEGNQVTSALTVTLPTPAPELTPTPVEPPSPSPAPPTPSASPSPSPTPSLETPTAVTLSPSASPSSTPTMAAAPVSTIGGNGPSALEIGALIVLLTGLAGGAVYAARRARTSTPPLVGEPSPAGGREPDVRQGAWPLDDASPTMAVAVPAMATASGVAPDAPGLAADAPGLAAGRVVSAARLTTREREVLSMLATGMSNRRIAEVLFIAESTAGVHVSNIMGKLGAESRTEAAAIAHRAGIVDPHPGGADGTVPLH